MDNPIFGYSPDRLSSYQHHNTFIGMFAETGLFGGISYILIFVFAYRKFNTLILYTDRPYFWYAMKSALVVVAIGILFYDSFIIKRFWFFILPLAFIADYEYRKIKTFVRVLH